MVSCEDWPTSKGHQVKTLTGHTFHIEAAAGKRIKEKKICHCEGSILFLSKFFENSIDTSSSDKNDVKI